jgi:hypothetical protein
MNLGEINVGKGNGWNWLRILYDARISDALCIT